MQDFEIPVGDTAAINLAVEDPEEESIAQALIHWRVFRQRYGNPIGEELFIKSSANQNEIEITEPSERKFRVFLKVEDTEDLEPGRYYHEAKIKTQGNDFTTAVKGFMTLLGVGFKPSDMN